MAEHISGLKRCNISEDWLLANDPVAGLRTLAELQEGADNCHERHMQV